MSKSNIAGIAIAVVLLAGILSWVITAPYLGNSGLARTPGVFIGGTLTDAPNDFTPLNGSVRGPMLMKQSGFPPFVNYLSWVGTPEGVISATRPRDRMKHVCARRCLNEHGGNPRSPSGIT